MAPQFHNTGWFIGIPIVNNDYQFYYPSYIAEYNPPVQRVIVHRSPKILTSKGLPLSEVDQNTTHNRLGAQSN